MRRRNENIGKLVNQYDAIEVMRRQTVALKYYLEWVKTKKLPPHLSTSGEVAVELYLANAAAVKCLLNLIAIAPEDLEANINGN